MPTLTKTDVVRCITSFVGDLKGQEISVHEGEILPANDAIVRNWPDFFETPTVSHQRGVEQATAAPGETRGGKVA